MQDKLYLERLRILAEEPKGNPFAVTDLRAAPLKTQHQSHSVNRLEDEIADVLRQLYPPDQAGSHSWQEWF